MPKILNGVTISMISSHGKFTDAQVSRWASSHSGRFSHNLDETVTHVLCTEQDYKAKGPKVRAALSLAKQARKGGRGRRGPLIVTEDWLEDSLTLKGRKQNEGPYLLESIDKTKRALKKKAQRVAKEEANGDRFVNGNMYDVWTDSTHFEYKVKLQRAKEVEPENQGQYYVLYLFQSRNKSPPLYFFAVKLYSKAGDRDPKQYRPSMTPHTLATEMARFEDFFRKKTGVQWDERLIKTSPMGKGKFSYIPPSGGKPVGEIRDKKNIPEKYVAVFQAAGILPTPLVAVDAPVAVAVAITVEPNTPKDKKQAVQLCSESQASARSGGVDFPATHVADANEKGDNSNQDGLEATVLENTLVDVVM